MSQQKKTTDLLFHGLDKEEEYLLSESPIAHGGEGSIHAIPSRPGFLAKIYKPDFLGHSTRYHCRLQKLLALTKIRPGGASRFAWPLDLLYRDDQLVGFVMPELSRGFSLGDILHRLVKEGYRNFPRRSCLTLALNLANAFQTVHRLGLIIGDMNTHNFYFNRNTGEALLMDVDSWHVQMPNGMLYPCNTYSRGYTAPEVLENPEKTRGLPYSQQSDLFGLAILIFQLLMGGVHPYARRKDSKGSTKSTRKRRSTKLQKRILRYRPSCFKSHGKKRPGKMPPMKVLTPELRALFRRAFLEEKPKKRPDTTAWIAALEAAEQNLETCKRDANHVYNRGLSACPFCSK